MRHARRLLNCWLVAMWFWGRSWFAHPVAIRRSHAFALVPHFIATMPSRWRHFFRRRVHPAEAPALDAG